MSAVLAVAWCLLIVDAGWSVRPPRKRAHCRTSLRLALGERMHRRQETLAVAAELPDVVDLFALAVGAGRNVTIALAAVAQRAPPHWQETLRAASDRVAAGDRLGDVLAALPAALGDSARPLATALAASARYGTPLLPVLERVAAEARADRRRRAEEAARRLPVTLLFPLVLCVLPAFGLLTLAPALAGALRTLRL
jgi:tight adherence protein C